MFNRPPTHGNPDSPSVEPTPMSATARPRCSRRSTSPLGSRRQMLQASHRSTEFLDFLKPIDAQVPPALNVHIIIDNYATHKTALVREWLARRPHYHVHLTPTSASWINQVKKRFAELTRKQLRRGVHTPTGQLERDIRAFIERHNENPPALSLDQVCRRNPHLRQTLLSESGDDIMQ